MAKLQFATLSNLQEFLNLHNVQIDSKIMKQHLLLLFLSRQEKLTK